MAVNDIYEVKMHFEAPSGYATSRFYVRETVQRSTIGTDTSVVGASVDAHIGPEVLEIMSDDWSFPSIEVNKVSPRDTQRFRHDRASIVGGKAGPSLPANNAIVYGLSQGTFDARHNGRIFFPPPAEVETTVSLLRNTFLIAEATNLENQLTTLIPEVDAGDGRYAIGVINTLVLNSSPPIKDWQNALALVTSVSVRPIVARQSRRQTKVRGAA